MKEDWYRSPDDSPEAMADFEQRLSRARPNNRAQYLRVKAVTLAQQPNQCARQIAIALLRRIISDFADEWHEVNFSHEMLGRIHENDGRFEEAEREYRWVVGAYAKSSSGTDNQNQTVSQVLRSGTVARTGRRQYHLQRGLVSILGCSGTACSVTWKALGLSQAKQPQFPRHPTLGIVRADSGILAEMLMLTTGGPSMPAGGVESNQGQCPASGPLFVLCDNPHEWLHWKEEIPPCSRGCTFQSERRRRDESECRLLVLPR